MANEKGTFSNPYTYEEYQNLHTKGKWHGGHVLYNGKIYYYNSNGILSSDDCDGCGSGSSSGCGCGSGSGSGCGCGNGYLREGQVTYRPVGWGVGLELVVAWGAGYFSALNKPSVSAALYVATNNVGLPLNASWEGNYRVRISGTVNLVDGSGNVLDTFNVSEYFNIPGSFYN